MKNLSLLHHRIIRSNFISAALAISLMTVCSAPDAFACHQKKGEPSPHGKQTSCDNGGSQFPPIQASSHAWFDDVFIFVRPHSFTRSASASYESGDYLADSPRAEAIQITTNSLSKTVIRGKPNGDLCHIMDEGSGNGPFQGAPDTFNFGWTDNCTDGECAIEISMSFDVGVDALTGGRSDRLEILMNGSVADASLQTVDEPFLVPQSIEATSVELDFKKPGSTRSLVVCRLGPQGEGSPTLLTEP